MVKRAAVERLRASVRGEVIEPDDRRYESVRRVWNLMIDRRPALIVRPADGPSVARVVAFARELDLPLAVRGGGHGVAGRAVLDGGVVLDLAALREVMVDSSEGIAEAGGGCLLADVDAATQAAGLAVPLGVVSATGIAGLTLGGGVGWLCRRHGLTVDNLLAAEVACADGVARRASAEEHRDLFWAIRGGGGNFGVVTSFRYRLHPVDPVLGGLLLFDAEPARVLDAYRELTDAAPRELGSICLRLRGPAEPFLPERLHGRPLTGVAFCYAGPVERGERLLRPLRALAPVADLAGVRPFAQHQSFFDGGANGPGGRHYWRSGYLDALDDRLLATFAELGEALPPGSSDVEVMQLGGAVADVSEGATAFHGREAGYIVSVVMTWHSAADDEARLSWARAAWERLRPFVTAGEYVNYADADGLARVRAIYGDDIYARLLAIKRRYDPDNVFPGNQNIDPRDSIEAP
jgi:FAD/FMN-containing dehydrogenase